MKEEIYEKKNIICSSGNGAGIVRLFDEKSIQKGSPPDMDITEDDTTGNPVKEPEIPGNKADWTILMYVCGSDFESEDSYAKWSKMLLCCNCWHTYTKITDGEYLFRFDIADVFGEHY